jgi:hypothetical protein
LLTGNAASISLQLVCKTLQGKLPLPPRELQVEHKGGVKAMTDEQLEAGIEAIQRMLEARGEGAKVIDAVPEPVALPAPPQAKRKVRKSERDVGHVGTADESGNS